MTLPKQTPMMIPMSLLRDLAAVVPDPMRPAQFVDLAELVAGRHKHSEPPKARELPVANSRPVPDKKGLPWKPAELQQARAMLNSGKGPSEIARELGRPVAATQVAIKRYGVRGDGPIKAPGRPKGRFGNVEPADRVANVRCDAWTDEDRARMSDMKAKGMSLAAIGAELGRTSEACRTQLKLMRDARLPVAPANAVWTPEQISQLQQARADGVSFRIIAAQLGRTVRACELRMAKLAKETKAKPDTDAVSPKLPAAQAPAPVGKVSASFAMPEQAKSPAPSAPAPAPSGLTEKQRRILGGLGALPDGFEPADDLLLAEGLIGRRHINLIADDLGCETRDVTARWKEMMFEDVVDWRGHPTIGGQSDLLIALRWRVDQKGADHV